MNISELAIAARNASIRLAASSIELRNNALTAMADALLRNADVIISANKQDLANAEAEGLTGAVLKRLVFDQAKLQGVVDGLHSLAALPDPLGKVMTDTMLADGLRLTRYSCPIGVIGTIFESRPDALVQISSLCLKSGNAVLLKGGREALMTNRALTAAIAAATAEAGLPADWIQLLETREDVGEMLKLSDCIDLIIPRGSNAFVKHIQQNTTIPVMGHSAGICHIYMDKAADADMAATVAVDAKTQYVSACNAVETILVHQAAAAELLPAICRALSDSKVEIRGCERSRAIVPELLPATDEDWDTEYLDYIVSIKVVDSMDEAIIHINCHGSGHTDAIITADEDAAEHFMRLVNSADVFWNASTRFADGFRFGLGAEVGIATGKIHARGPVGLEGLTIYKWCLRGKGDTVAPFANGSRKFTHQQLM